MKLYEIQKGIAPDKLIHGYNHYLFIYLFIIFILFYSHDNLIPRMSKILLG